MNKLDYYNRQKEAWDDREFQDVRDEYEIKEMTVSQIADIHRRTPGSIHYKLKSLGIILHGTLSRGYMDYIHSNLYREIIETGDANKMAKKEATLKAKMEKKEAMLKSKMDKDVTFKAKKVKKEVKINTKMDNSQISIVPFKEIIEMQIEITDLKKDVKELLRLMNALYDFESQ